MHETSNIEAQPWEPPPRPDWVQEVIDEGRRFDIRSVVPLDERSLLETAIRNTGLSDFGADDWREPFRIYIRALEEEADLHLIDRTRARMETLLLLEARLRVEDAYKRNPEIEREQIRKPIIVLGQGRCGSSFLQAALGANADDGTLRQWESVFPCPPPLKETYDTDPRIDIAEKIVTQWYRIQPEILSMHTFGARVPFEDTMVLGINFMSATWCGVMGQVPTYDAHIAALDPLLRLRYHQRVLKLLQWQNPRRHWVLKDLYHLTWLPSLLQLYPDACFVWIHRDPVRATASQINLMGSMQRCSSDRVLRPGSMDWLKDPAAMFNGVIDQLEQGVVPRERICNVHFKDMVRDPIGTLEAIYRHHDIPFTAAGRRGVAKYLAENPRDARPAHRFSIPSGRELERARRSYRRYQEYFGVPSE